MNISHDSRPFWKSRSAIASLAFAAITLFLLFSEHERISSARRDVKRNVGQDVLFAFAYNAIGISDAAGVRYSWLGIL
jgi:hypothetical protein